MQHDTTLQDQIETVEANLAVLIRKAETGEQWAEIALIEDRDLVPLLKLKIDQRSSIVVGG